MAAKLQQAKTGVLLITTSCSLRLDICHRPFRGHRVLPMATSLQRRVLQRTDYSQAAFKYLIKILYNTFLLPYSTVLLLSQEYHQKQLITSPLVPYTSVTSRPQTPPDKTTNSLSDHVHTDPSAQTTMESLVNLASKLSINSRQPNQASSALPWWKEAVCYQVWPNSFKDSTGNGHGDIRGVIEKLDYIKDLGIDCIWLSPTYKSPMKDQGYDISDYEDINPNFGNMQDMKDLIAGVHKRGMKIILDLVINHTSDQHAWFKESRSSTDNAKKDWYIWRPPRYDKNGERLPPTNWRAALVGGSAWEWCEERQQYYLHLFLPSQPDVNFECEEARQAIFQSAIVSWLKLGVDGFRIDTVNRYSKRDFDDAEGHDNDSYFQDAEKHVMNGPRLHPYIQEMRREMDKHAKGELLLVGELPDCTKDEVLDFVLASRHEISMVFDFDMVKMGGNDAPDYWVSRSILNQLLKTSADVVSALPGQTPGAQHG